MILPPGVKYRPNRPGLICGLPEDDSLIRVPSGYKIQRHTLARALEPSVSGAWYAWATKHALSFSGPAYAVANNGEFVIEVAPEIPPRNSLPGTPRLFAGVFDVFTPEGGTLPPAARLCEFQTYGMALIDCGAGLLDLFVAQAGDKVV